MGAEDTIVAVVTPPGRGGVGIVRFSGPNAFSMGQRLFSSPRADFAGFKPYRLHHGTLLDATGRHLDDVLAAYMPGPGSYTGEDVVEFNCHGSPAILRALVGAALALGARHAAPGEFTKRAFLAGRMDLSQAQAVAELVAADTLAGAGLALSRLEGLMARRVGELRSRLEALRMSICLAVDFPEDEGECLDPPGFLAALTEVMDHIGLLISAHGRARPFREGELAVLAGPVNAGKSSLLNALIGRERAIVCDVPGTTRDFLEEQLDLDGLPVRLVDTAGLRETDDPVEREGLSRCARLLGESRAVLLVVDGSRDFDPSELSGALSSDCTFASLDPARTLAVVNKCDLPLAGRDPALVLAQAGFSVVRVSARTGHGLEELCRTLRARLLGSDAAPPESEPVPNDRECALLAQAREELSLLAADLEAGVPPDLLGVRLETACAHLAAITGEITPDGVLNAVFDGFCIGK
ncbi:MAG: tRNA modification [Desulfovibrionaceae bacterium]|nr:MAG: tRNA modification [Desulfovibrionaceae bacterium]